jgi:hypothetical protein
MTLVLHDRNVLSGVQVPRRRFHFSLRILLLLLIPIILVIGLAIWFFSPAPLDVDIKIEKFVWYQGIQDNGTGLGAKVWITNRSSSTVWYMENPRYCLLQLVDGQWLESSLGAHPPTRPGGTEQDWWSSQAGKHSIEIVVGPISEKATVIKIVIPYTTDRFMPKRHWVSSPEVKIVKKGEDYFPEIEKGAICKQSLDAPSIFSRRKGDK